MVCERKGVTYESFTEQFTSEAVSRNKRRSFHNTQHNRNEKLQFLSGEKCKRNEIKLNMKQHLGR